MTENCMQLCMFVIRPVSNCRLEQVQCDVERAEGQQRAHIQTMQESERVLETRRKELAHLRSQVTVMLLKSHTGTGTHQ